MRTVTGSMLLKWDIELAQSGYSMITGSSQKSRVPIVPSCATRRDLAISSTDKKLTKVVIHFDHETVKGFIETLQLETIDSMLLEPENGFPRLLNIRRLGRDNLEEIDTEKAKAIFYVKDFDGNAEHRDLHFSKRAPLVQGIWIRLEFVDGEVMEGLIHNTVRFLIDAGFFIRPTDPNSNNRLVYVRKRWLKNCQVLGLHDI